MHNSADAINEAFYDEIGDTVVLCEDLTLRQAPGTNAGILDTLHDGARIIVYEQKDGWAHIFTGDSEDSAEGWVKAE